MNVPRRSWVVAVSTPGGIETRLVGCRFDASVADVVAIQGCPRRGREDELIGSGKPACELCFPVLA